LPAAGALPFPDVRTGATGGGSRARARFIPERQCRALNDDPRQQRTRIPRGAPRGIGQAIQLAGSLQRYAHTGSLWHLSENLAARRSPELSWPRALDWTPRGEARAAGRGDAVALRGGNTRARHPAADGHYQET